MQAAVRIQEEYIQHWILHACHFNGIPELASKIQYRFNNRLSIVFGQAWCEKKLIDIAPVLWERASPVQRRKLIIHETCHIICRHKFGPNVGDHGKEWKQSMINAGVPAERCHHVSTAGLRRKYVKYEIACDCRRAWIGHVKAARVRKQSHTCRKCKGAVKLTGNEHRV